MYRLKHRLADKEMPPLRGKPEPDPVFSALVCFQTEHTFRANPGVVHHPGREIEPVARLER